jgi:hypothetical protein
MKTAIPVHRYFCGAADRLLFVLEAHKVCPDSSGNKVEHLKTNQL